MNQIGAMSRVTTRSKRAKLTLYTAIQGILVRSGAPMRPLVVEIGIKTAAGHLFK